MRTYKVYFSNTYKGCIQAETKWHAQAKAKEIWGNATYKVKPLS